MKDFMLIFIGTDYGAMGLSPEEMQKRMGKWFEWQSKMAEQGVVKGGHALHPEMRLIKGKERTVTDLASVEAKELVGGYYIVSAKDIEGASELAQGYPDYDLGGTVEIREVIVFEN